MNEGGGPAKAGHYDGPAKAGHYDGRYERAQFLAQPWGLRPEA